MSDSPAQSTATPEQISAAEAAKVARYVRSSKTVAIISLALTLLTVAIALLTKGSILYSMLIAGLNVVAVAYYAMHLNAEKSQIRRAVFLAVFFLVDMFFVFHLAFTDRIHQPAQPPPQTQTSGPK